MKLSDLAQTPQLIEITISDDDIIKEYGEGISFYTWDRQPLEVFLRLSNISDDNSSALMDSVRTLVLDENGKGILTNDIALPNNVLLKVITKVVESLGKL
jgi:hypothetical protein